MLKTGGKRPPLIKVRIEHVTHKIRNDERLAMVHEKAPQLLLANLALEHSIYGHGHFPRELVHCDNVQDDAQTPHI